MLASLHGKLEALGGEWAIINVHGIGFQVYLPAQTLGALGTAGEEVHLHTHLHVREDNVTLYGFGSTAERELFQLLLSVSGIGPKLAMAILSNMSIEQVSLAISSENSDMLTMVPGIGKKIASRLTLELKDKIGTGIFISTSTQTAQESTDVISALTALGYSQAEAARAITTLSAGKKMSLEEKVKLALQYFRQK